MTMRIALTVVLLALISFGNAAQDSPLKADGRMWETFSNSGSQGSSIKAAYVQGAIEGLRAGAARGYSSSRMDEKKDALAYAKQCIDEGPCANVPIASFLKPPDADEMTRGMDKVLSDISPQHASVFDIVHQMDKFYSDYRNMPVCMIVAAQESIQSLKGKASTEQGLELERQQGCNP
jgi:hypothetical protein